MQDIERDMDVRGPMGADSGLCWIRAIAICLMATARSC